AAVVPEYYTYGRETDGTLWTQVNIASATSARWRKVWTDWMGRTVKTESPGFTGQPNFIEDYFYESGTGRLQKLKRTGYAPERYEYDALSRLVRTGTDVDNSGTLVPSSNDRIAETDRFFEYLEGAWWLREDTKGCLTASSGVSTTISTVRTRLTGLTETLRAETRTTDVDGTVLTRVVTVDRPAKTVITTETGLASASTEERTVAGFPITIKTRAGVVHTTNYDSLGRKVGEIDPRTGGSFTFGYKTSTGLREWTRDGGGVPLSTVAYDSSGRVVSDRDANNQSAYFSYNSRGQLSRRWGATSYPVEYAYNSYGERTAMRTFRNTALSFSAVSWPLADTLNDNPATPPADGDRTLWAFDAPSGLLWKKTDAPTAEHPNGKTAMFSYTPRGQTYQRTSARGIVTTYRYFGDSAGEPETGELRTVDYNDATPDVSYTYTRLGQIASVTDNTGVRAFGYAASTSWRLASETLSAYFGSRVLTRRYDTAGGDYTFGTYAAGHMQGREEGFELGVEGAPARDLRQTMVFANYGRFAGIRTEAANTTAQDIVYSYIPTAAAQPQAGLPSRLVKGYTVSGTNFAVSRGYAAMLDLVTWIESKWNTTNLVRFDYTYNSLRQRKFSSQSGDAYADYGATSGMFHRYHYNTRGELESAALYRGTGADNPSSTDEYPGRRFEYRYDPIGNRRTAGATGLVANDDEYVTNALNQHTQKENNTIRVLGTASLTASLAVMGTPPSGPAPTVTRKDKAFAAEVFPANTGGPARGTVDVYAAQPGGAAGGADLANKTTRSYTAPRQTQSLTYDDDGNLTYDGVWSYSYDAENRLTSMISVLPAGFGFARQRLAFGYDYRGRRFYKEVFDLDNADSLVSARRFIYNGWDLVAELDAFNPSNVVLARSYTWGLDVEGSLGGAGGVGALVRMVDHVAGKTLLPCYDGNGNVVALANGASGTLEAIYEYSPFGELLRAEGTYAKANPFPFSTKFQGEETGLVYYGARFYSPGLGRFLNRDPIAEQGGLNLYGFCGNDGINRWDVLGMFYFGVPPIKQEDSGGHGRSRDRDSKNSVAPDPWLYDLPAFVFYAASGNIQVPPPIRAGPRDSGGTSNGSGPNRGGPLDGIVSRNRAIAAELGVSDDYERQVRSADGLRDVIVNGTQLAADLNVGLIVAQMLEGRSVTGEKYGVKDYVIGAVSLIPPAGRGQAVARCSREESEPS
ncbi:MAG: RHS repeat-associated core domain-containing protein, partial [Verrucomicrobia bacterium]|nr:RHS repeat-associated core domain-containing protein [Verrucomicrobiota bacterium]